MRSVSADFVLAMHQKLEAGDKKGYKGWQSHWKNIPVDSFTIHNLLNKLEEEFCELEDLVFDLLDYDEVGTAADVDLGEVRLEAADVANLAMMIADMAGALNDE